MAFFSRRFLQKGGEAAAPPLATETGDLDRRLAQNVARAATRDDPTTVRAKDCLAWQGNPGGPDILNLHRCQALIDDIAAQNGNTVPVKVRRLAPGGTHAYEILMGHRRHFAVQWLNHNGRPEILLKVEVVTMSDEEVFRQRDAEHRDRDDGDELVRARGYEIAVGRFYGGVQSRMAEALSLSNSQISRLLSLAQLPQEVVRAFPTPDELRVRHAEVLTPLLRRPAQRALIIQAASVLANEQQELALRHEPMLPAATVVARLKRAALTTQDPPPEQQAIQIDGNNLGFARTDNQRILSFDVTVPPTVDLEKLLDHLRAVIVRHRENNASAC